MYGEPPSTWPNSLCHYSTTTLEGRCVHHIKAKESYYYFYNFYKNDQSPLLLFYFHQELQFISTTHNKRNLVCKWDIYFFFIAS